MSDGEHEHVEKEENIPIEPTVNTIKTESGLISSIQTGGSLNAVSASPDGTLVAVGGRKVYKVFKLTEDGFSLQVNFRTAKKNMNYGAVDLKWHPLPSCAHLIATAPTNGKVVIWNLNSRVSGKLERQFDQHTRTVNSICWRPYDEALLLSGSQDGTVKLWAGVAQSYACNSEVRSVKFSPHYNNIFAAGIESGDIQIWDMRKEGGYQRSFSAHNGLILSVDWHPFNKSYVATGGRDRVIKVWDMNNAQRPVYSVQTIASVSQLLWRPQHNYQLVSCANMVDHNVHLWNLSSPYVPLLTFEGHKDVVTGMLWHQESPDQLVTCSKDGNLMIQPITNSKYPKANLPTTAISFNARSELAIVNEHINRNQHQEHNKFYEKQSQLVVKSQGPRFAFTENRIIGNIAIVKDTSQTETEDFLYFAHHYELFRGSAISRCQHNAQVALARNRNDLARMWMLLESLQVPIVQTSPQVSPAREDIKQVVDDEDVISSFDELQYDDKEFEDGIQTSDSSFPEDQYNPAFAIPTSPTNYSPPNLTPSAHLTPPHHAFLINSPPTHETIPPVEHPSPPSMVFYEEGQEQGTDTTSMFAEVLVDTLDYYSELGDAQTCASIVAVVGSEGIENERVLHWYLAYVELLSRHRSFSTMNELIQSCAEPYIRSLNKQSTSIKTCCGKCGTLLNTKGDENTKTCVSSTVCEKCTSQTARCAICRLPVQGAFFWCQKCGYGGHLNHMMNWFKKYGSCPTCGVDVSNVQKMY